MGHRKTITSTFRHMRTSILVDVNEEKFYFLIYCMSEVSGTNELPLFRNNNIVNLGAWLNLMLVILASVSKPANSQ